MTPRVRRFVLGVHLTFSTGWIGAALAYLALGVSAIANRRGAKAAWSGMDLIGWYVIVPLAAGSLFTGIVLALGTKWGLFRHWWVVISFVLTALSTVILVSHMPSVSSIAELAQAAEGPALAALGGDLLHPSLGLAILLVIHFLNLYKPAGLTRYGWRMQQRNGTPIE